MSYIFYFLFSFCAFVNCSLMVVFQKILAECTGSLEKVINALLLQINALGKHVSDAENI